MLEFEQTDEPPPGYFLSGPDNNAGMYLWSGGSWEACSRCGAFSIPTDVVNPEFNLDIEEDELIDYGGGAIEAPASRADAKRIFDFSFTYDSWRIVSTAFRDAVLANSSTAVEFDVLPREPGFFVLRPLVVLEIDIERSKVSFGPTCEVCGRAQGAWGAISHLRHPEALDPFGIYRSDVERGDVNRMGSDVMVGPELAHRLRPLNGVVLYNALSW